MGEHLGNDELAAGALCQVASLLAAAAITAPSPAGSSFWPASTNFMEAVLVEDADERHRLAEWLRARGAERRERIWFRDAEVAEAVDAVLFVGLLPE